MKRDKVLSMLGIAKKAGKIVSGEFSTENSIKDGTACLVIVATDSSDNTKKRFKDMCIYRDIPIRFYSSKDNLGQSMGNEFRASLALTDAGLADSIMKLIDEADHTEVV